MNIFDGHTDILADVVARRLAGETDAVRQHHLEKLTLGQVTGGNFVLWMDPKTASMEMLINAMKHISMEMDEANDFIFQIRNAMDFRQAQTTGKMALVLGMEGLSAIGDDLTQIDWLYQQGVRCASLTWNEANTLATGIEGETSRGLTHVGKEAVEKMENLGILVDVSHLNETSFWDVIQLAQEPVMASHSNAWTLCQHPRNLKDEQIKAIGNSGGLVGVNAWPDFLHEHQPSVDHYVEQIDYLVSLIGIDGVILGFDFCDFMPTDPDEDPDQKLETESLENAASAQQVIKRLTKKGYGPQDLEKIAWKNMMRVYGRIMKI